MLIHHQPPALLANKLMDLYATLAQRQPFPPSVPVPSFTMDRFTPFHPSFGYVETNLSSFVSHLLAFTFSQGSSFQPLRRLPHDSHPPPTHPYLHATSAFSATLQLYLRSAQLDTADVTGGLGTPPSAVVWAALPLKPPIMFLSSALPFLRFRGLICGLWCKQRATFYQQSCLVWGKPSAPLLVASSVMMWMFGRSFTPCIVLESYHHSL